MLNGLHPSSCINNFIGILRFYNISPKLPKLSVNSLEIILDYFFSSISSLLRILIELSILR